MDFSWHPELDRKWKTEPFQKLEKFLETEPDFYPPVDQVFQAFRLTPLEKVKIVILGQDPYPNVGQAMGLSFSVPPGVKPPRSLVNVYKELNRDVGVPISKSGCLEAWAKQGVLLLNSVLTVRPKMAGSHRKKGWEEWTDAVIDCLCANREHLVFMLWGNYAKEKGARIDRSRHLVLESGHPSPLAIGSSFHGCGHFSKANEYLVKHGVQAIDWTI